jgi:hypothetical protein
MWAILAIVLWKMTKAEMCKEGKIVLSPIKSIDDAIDNMILEHNLLSVIPLRGKDSWRINRLTKPNKTTRKERWSI